MAKYQIVVNETIAYTYEIDVPDTVIDEITSSITGDYETAVEDAIFDHVRVTFLEMDGDAQDAAKIGEIGTGEWDIDYIEKTA